MICTTVAVSISLLVYVILFGIFFSETGLVFMTFLPVLAALRRHLPVARLEVLGYPHIAQLALVGGLVDRVQIIHPIGAGKAAGLRFHFRAGLFCLSQQVCILDCDSQLSGQRFEGGQEFTSQGVGFFTLQIQHAHHFSTHDQGHCHFRTRIGQ